MEEIKELFQSFFKRSEIKQYVIITVLSFSLFLIIPRLDDSKLLALSSFLIIPSFTLFGYAVNAIQYSSEKRILEVTKEKNFVELTKEGFFFMIFAYVSFSLLKIVLLLLSPIIVYSGLYFEEITRLIFSNPILLVIPLSIIIVVQLSLMVSYAKNRSMIDAFSSGDYIKYLKTPKFFLYSLISVITLILFTITFIGFGVGLVLSHAILGLVIKNE